MYELFPDRRDGFLFFVANFHFFFEVKGLIVRFQLRLGIVEHRHKFIIDLWEALELECLCINAQQDHGLAKLLPNERRSHFHPRHYNQRFFWVNVNRISTEPSVILALWSASMAHNHDNLSEQHLHASDSEGIADQEWPLRLFSPALSHFEGHRLICHQEQCDEERNLKAHLHPECWSKVSRDKCVVLRIELAFG